MTPSPSPLTSPTVNEPPRFPSTLNRALDVDENAAAGQNVDQPLSADDEEHDALTYSLDSAGRRFFDITADGQLQTRASLDHETRSSYSFTVRVSDGGDANGDADSAIDDSTAVTVTVNDTEEDGVINVPSDQPQVGTALAATLSDSDGNVSGVTWQWQASGDQNSWSDIKSATSASYTPVAADQGRYLRIFVSYSDRRGSGKSARISLPNPVQAAPPTNSAPEFPSSSSTRTVPENTPSGETIGRAVTATDPNANDRNKLIYTLGGAGASSFGIVETTGELLTLGTLDHETRDSYSVNVTATDPSLASDSITVIINVTDVNEAPAFPSSLRAAFSIDENTEAGRDIGQPLTAIEQDVGDSLTYSLDRTADSIFEIDAEKGQLRTEAPLDYERRESYRFDIFVSDGDDADGKPDAAIDDTFTLTVRVRNVNERPVAGGETDISYAEQRTDPVATYTAEDSDEGTTITWSLSGDDAGDFRISAAGVLTFRNQPDFEDPADGRRRQRVSGHYRRFRRRTRRLPARHRDSGRRQRGAAGRRPGRNPLSREPHRRCRRLRPQRPGPAAEHHLVAFGR